MNKKGKYDGYYCTRPFDWFSALDNGNVVPCCPPWVNGYTFGNLNDNTVEEVWNSDKAKKFRESILDGSYRYCNEKSCPHMQSKSECVLTLDEIITAQKYQVHDDIVKNRTHLSHGPMIINCDYDRSCNLSCPSCRPKTIIITGEKKKRALEMQDMLIKDGFKDATHITCTASGDAFASPVFRTMLQQLKPVHAPKLQKMTILSNGLLIKKYWPTLSDYTKEKVQYISISIDAASADVYKINRRGGNWDDLKDNLSFIRDLRKAGDIKGFLTSFVVQENNFHQIKDFFNLCKDYNVDCVQLQIFEPDFLRDLGCGTYFDEWVEKAVQERTHPKHQQLLEIIRDGYFEKYINRFNNRYKGSADYREYNLQDWDTVICMNMGPLYDLRIGKDISQYEENLREYNIVEKLNKKKKMAQLGLIKDVWYDGTAHFVQLKFLKKIDGTDVVKLDTNDVLKWSSHLSKWVKCSKNSYEYKKYQEMVEA